MVVTGTSPVGGGAVEIQIRGRGMASPSSSTEVDLRTTVMAGYGSVLVVQGGSGVSPGGGSCAAVGGGAIGPLAMCGTR
jgi:hypothetical protein